VLFPLALGEPEAYFEAVHLVFFIDVLDEDLKVFSGFSGFGCHDNNNYSINRLG